ncbi:hypothetical protein evm_009504 [Chilo suppressalis]|nr:hypothetical protein evm_009504 [Chilo suppressalis]
MSQVHTKSGDSVQDEKVLLPYTYIQQVPGKQIRSKLTSAFNYWLKVSDEKLHAIGEIIQMLHNSSLLYVVQSEDFFYSILQRVVLKATAVYTEQLLDLHRGQGLEIYWRDNFQCPSEDEYKQMTIKKTGGLFMLAIRLMQLFSDNKSDFSKLAAIFGLYFQIRDDYCNLCLQEYSENKSYCEDLTEGKFSFPIIHAIRNQKGDNQVLHILRQRTRDVEVKRYCISLLERLGSFAYTRATLTQLDADARAEVAALGGNPLLEALLDDLLSWKRDGQHTIPNSA